MDFEKKNTTIILINKHSNNMISNDILLYAKVSLSAQLSSEKLLLAVDGVINTETWNWKLVENERL